MNKTLFGKNIQKRYLQNPHVFIQEDASELIIHRVPAILVKSTHISLG